MRYLIAVIVAGLIIGALVPRGVALLASNPPAPQAAPVNTEAQDRQALQNAANRVDASPCDTRQRQVLSDAFDAYTRHMTATSDDRVETLTLADGRVIDISRRFDDPVEDAWRFALTKTCEN
jgi:hypothetical protein